MENTRHEFKKIRNEYNFEKECGNCGSVELLQIHHIVPLALGGTNRRGNLCMLCKDCHEKAHGGTTLVDFNCKVKQQNRGGGNIPFGYRKSKGKIVRAHGHKLIRTIIELRMIHKMSSITIAQALNDLGIESPRGGSWSSQQILNKTISNERYFQGENIAEPVMKDSIVDWDMVLKHNDLNKGQKRTEYNNKDVELAKRLLKDS